MKKPYLLIHETVEQYESYPVCFESFEEQYKMDDRVNELALQLKERLKIHFAGKILEEYEYAPLEKVISYQRQTKK